MKALMLFAASTLLLLSLASNARAASYAIGVCNPTNGSDCTVLDVTPAQKECLDEQYALIEENEDSYSPMEIIEQTNEVPSLCDVTVK